MNIEAVVYYFTMSWKWDSILFRKKFADGILFATGGTATAALQSSIPRLHWCIYFTSPRD